MIGLIGIRYVDGYQRKGDFFLTGLPEFLEFFIVGFPDENQEMQPPSAFSAASAMHIPMKFFIGCGYHPCG